MSMGMVYGLATLKHPYFQQTFERMGWQLIGIMPGFDQELVAPGEVRRVYEAVYVKVLEPSTLLAPDQGNMTEAVRELYALLFERSHPGGADAWPLHRADVPRPASQPLARRSCQTLGPWNLLLLRHEVVLER